MPTRTMTVASIYPPKPGKARGNIKSEDGSMLGCFADKFHLFEIGQTYDVEYTETVSNGVTYRNVKAATLIAPPPRRQEPRQPTPAAQRPGPRAVPPAAAPKPQAAPSNLGDSYNTYRETSAKDAERMFVCSTLNAFIQAGKVHLEMQQLVEATMMLRHLWQYAFNSKAAPAPQRAGSPQIVAAE